MKLDSDLRFFVDGLLNFAIPVFIFSVSDVYIRWKLYGSPSDRFTYEMLFDKLATASICGVIEGLMSVFRAEKTLHK